MSESERKGKMKVCLIKQPAGLGDILYTQKIAEHYRSLGYRILWPVISSYAWLKDYIKGVTFINEERDFPYKNFYNSTIVDIAEEEGFIYVPLQYADLRFPDMKIMESKYRLAGIPSEGWQDSLSIKRNRKKEDELFYNVLGLEDDKEYCFINKMWGPPTDIKRNSSLKVDESSLGVELRLIDGYTLFDWSKVVEKASSIHITHTSIAYMIENLNLSAQKLNQYLPEMQKQFDQVGNLFSKVKWNYIYD